MDVNKQGIITVYSHFFKVTNVTPRFVRILLNFCANYVLMIFAKLPGRQKPALVPSKVFAGRMRNNSEFRFHIGQLNEFMAHLGYNHINSDMYDIKYIEPQDGVPIDAKMKEGWVLKDYQEDVVKFVTESDSTDNHSRLVALPTGKGKEQPLDAKIRTPKGWSTMGEMQIGTPVIAKDGTITEVTGVYPQGLKRVYVLTFEDRRTAECGAEHLWKVYTSSNKRATSQVLEIQDIMRSLSRGTKIFIDAVEPELAEEEDFPLNTYLVGDTINSGILDKVLWLLHKPFRLFNLEVLRFLFVFNPDHRYLQGTELQRRQMLHSFCDHVVVNSSDRYMKIQGLNKLSRRIVRQLVHSLGGVCYIEDKLVYFRLGEMYSGIKYNKKIRLLQVERRGVKEMQCISIAHPEHLYVTNDFIVTHNTVSALSSISKIEQRTAIVILPKFISKWGEDILAILKVSPKDIMLIQGSSQLKGVISAANDGLLNIKFLIVSITTLQNFYKDYENGEDVVDVYGCLPEELWPKLGIGTIIIDEVHCHIFSVYKTMLYTNVKKVIALSATFISEDLLVQRVQKLMFPKEIRFDSITMDKYIKVYAVSFQFNKEYARKIRSTEFGSNLYSHNAFEQSILKNKQILNNYIHFIDHLVQLAYIDDYIPGDKLVIFAYRTDMCDVIHTFLKKKYSHLDVRRYVKEDPYVNAIEPDIRVSTILSLGTAIDIPNLRAAIMTTSISSEVSNRQTLGRLRALKDRDVKFYYTYSTDIPKQVEYHVKKKIMFEASVASIKDLVSPIEV